MVQDLERGEEMVLVQAQGIDVVGDGLAVGVHLLQQQLARFAGLVTVVKVFDSLFEADGDEQTDDDGGDVEEEVAPGVGAVVGRMDVEHEGLRGLREV
jgi:hypothetical protein